MFDKREKRWYSFTTEDGLPNNNVRTLAITEDALWVGTPDGLGALPHNRWVPSMIQSDGWQQFNLTQPGVAMGHENVRDICVVDDQVWLGTIGGLGLYSSADNSWRAIRAKERTVVLRHSDIQRTELDGDWVWFLAWQGTSNGEIVRYDRRTGSWTHYVKEDVTEIHQKDSVSKADNLHPLTPNDEIPYITQIHWMEVADDSVWFATDGGGASLL